MDYLKKYFKNWQFVPYIYFFVFSVIQYIVFAKTPNEDYSEQLILSQSWKFSYITLPPLYTYIVKLTFMLFGPSLLILYFIKAAILSLIIHVNFLIAEEIGLNRKQQIISLLGYGFLPNFIWKAQYDLTHSILAVLFCALFLLFYLRIDKSSSELEYAKLGLFSALAFLSKLNSLLFILIVVFSDLTQRDFKRKFTLKKSLLSLFVFIFISCPYLWDLILNLNIFTDNLNKSFAIDSFQIITFLEYIFGV